MLLDNCQHDVENINTILFPAGVNENNNHKKAVSL
jgi:mannitol/fructose-specific phosphotransferase system IIA component (Ntr-type)